MLICFCLMPLPVGVGTWFLQPSKSFSRSFILKALSSFFSLDLASHLSCSTIILGSSPPAIIFLSSSPSLNILASASWLFFSACTSLSKLLIVLLVSVLALLHNKIKTPQLSIVPLRRLKMMLPSRWRRSRSRTYYLWDHEALASGGAQPNIWHFLFLLSFLSQLSSAQLRGVSAKFCNNIFLLPMTSPNW